MRRSVHRIARLAACALLITACSGSDGSTGPAGPVGPEGMPGPQGPQGNADVTLYEFGPRTFNGMTTFEVDLTEERVDQSFYLVFYNPSSEAETSWYPSPGIGSSGAYQTRYYLYRPNSAGPYTFVMRILDANTGAAFAGSVTFSRTRIFVIPASSSVASAIVSRQLDPMDYNAVSEMVRSTSY